MSNNMRNFFTAEAKRLEEQYMAAMEREFEFALRAVLGRVSKRYPRREIKILFGMDTYVVDGFANTYLHLGLADSYGNLDSWDQLSQSLRDRLAGTDLAEMMQLLNDGVDMCGRQLLINNLYAKGGVVTEIKDKVFKS